MDFGGRLKQILDERGISQKNFAKMINIAPTTLNGYIRNTRQPDFELVKNISCVLNVSLDYLFGCENKSDICLEEEKLLNKYRKLSAKNKELLLDIAEALAGELK